MSAREELLGVLGMQFTVSERLDRDSGQDFKSICSGKEGILSTMELICKCAALYTQGGQIIRERPIRPTP